MWRRLLNLLVGLSLLFSAATCVCAWRSSGRRDNLWSTSGNGGRLWWLESADGRVALRSLAAWPGGAWRRWAVAPADADPVQLSRADERPLVWFGGPTSPASPGDAYSRVWEIKRLGLRVRYGRGYTTTTGRSLPDYVLFGSPAALGAPVPNFEVIVPYGILVAATTLPAAAWSGARLAAAGRRRRARRGLCSVCGYDLRATPGRCPECGTEAAPPGFEREART